VFALENDRIYPKSNRWSYTNVRVVQEHSFALIYFDSVGFVHENPTASHKSMHKT
jgi:hypothetical protein